MSAPNPPLASNLNQPRPPSSEPVHNSIRHILTWTLLALPVAVLAGSASAFFLWSLEEVTSLRWQNPGLLFGLPLGGFAIGWLYHRFGRNAEAGTALVMEEVHQPGGGVPSRMAPLILIGTLVTHLFGGSAGREGTAVQMGGSLAATCARWFRLTADNLRVLLMCGIAAGFGSVFGTPFAGAIFALEVLIVGRVQYNAFIPLLTASLVGNYVCAAWGIHHTHYVLNFSGDGYAWFNAPLVLKIVLVSIAFGLASRLFAGLTHAIGKLSKNHIAYPPLRPVVGGLLVIALVYVIGTRDYLGLGVSSPDPAATTLLSAFTAGGATPWSWWWKLLFTAITLGFGFKGGEVTPLFFIGATLGHALALALNAPIDLFAALGFIAIFAGATNTPFACVVMGMELFGSHNTVYFIIACFVAYLFSAKLSLYHAHRPAPATTGSYLKNPFARL